jgi:tetratricopeptide (TPR) repeat protein/transcriptional regulator with XRE-family HTH domain
MPDRASSPLVNLRPFRLRALMTQEELAFKAGVGVRTIRDIESGRIRPQSKTVRLLAKALGLDADAVASLTGTSDPGAAPQAIAPVALPSSTSAFTGRSDLLASLDEAADASRSPLVVLTGAGGIGKTMLALHWGHRSADRFPGGRIYIDLRGFAPGGTAMEPAEAVRQLLGALGVEPQRIPTGADAQFTLYRTIIGGARRLLILDNARDAAQVRPLLPDASQVHTVVISRRRLAGLAVSHGAKAIEIGAFDRAESAALLRRQLGAPRLAAEPEATERVLTACAGLPLALAIAGARAAMRPDRTLRAVADELETSRLDALAVDDDSVDLRAVFSWSYPSLDPDAAKLFRLLALVPGPDFSTAAAVRLHGGPQAERALRTLIESHLLEDAGPGRHRFHDLIRLYATELLEAEEPESERDNAFDRLLDWYLRGADGCRSALYPAMIGLPAAEGDRWEPTGEEAAQWLKAEWENLIAAVEAAAERGREPFAWLMADTVRGYVWLHMLGGDGVRLSAAALTAATSAGDPLGRAAAALALACAQIRCEQLDDAIDHLRDAADFARRADWAPGAASAEGNLAVACYYRGRMREGREHAFAALHAFRAIGEHRAECTNLHWLGLFHYLLGELDAGVDYLEQALKIATDAGNDPVSVVLLTHLAENEIHRGRLSAASARLEQAAELERGSVSIDRSNDMPRTIARLRLAQGRIDEALELAERAVEERTDADDHRNRTAGIATLAAVRDGGGDYGEAIALYDRVLAMTELEPTVYHRVEAMVNRSGALLRTGDAAAEEAATVALRTAGDAGYRFLEGRALNVLAGVDLEAGRLAAADDHVRQALLIHRETGHRPGEAEALRILAAIALAAGDTEAARQHRVEARDLFTEIGTTVPADLA